MQAPPYPGISSLGAWRGLLARGALLSACATRLAQLHDLAFAYETVAGTISDLAKAAGVAQPAVSDRAAVSRAVRRWDAAILDWLNVSTTAAQDECSLLSDVRKLSASATPADPFDALFTAVCDLGAGVYGDRWPTPVLNVNDLPRHPRNPPDRYAITAKTSLKTNPPTVTLLVYPGGLDPAAFAALPGLLAHECICHVPAQQDRVKNDSRFAEGFMDWAATYFFIGVLSHVLPDLSEAAKAHFGPFADLFGTPATPEGRARRRGHYAANHLVALVTTELGISDLEAQGIVARVARDLNCAPAPIDKKDLLVAGIEALPRPSEALSAELLWGVLTGTRPAADLL